MIKDRGCTHESCHIPDLDLPPEVREVCLLAQVELPVAVLELGDVVGTLAQGHLEEGHGELCRNSIWDDLFDDYMG